MLMRVFLGIPLCRLLCLYHCLLLMLLYVLCTTRIDVGGSSEGLELSITVRASIPDDVSLQKAEQSVLTAFQEVIAAVLDGRIV